MLITGWATDLTIIFRAYKKPTRPTKKLSQLPLKKKKKKKQCHVEDNKAKSQTVSNRGH